MFAQLYFQWPLDILLERYFLLLLLYARKGWVGIVNGVLKKWVHFLKVGPIRQFVLDVYWAELPNHWSNRYTICQLHQSRAGRVGQTVWSRGTLFSRVCWLCIVPSRLTFIYVLLWISNFTRRPFIHCNTAVVPKGRELGRKHATLMPRHNPYATA